MSDIAVIPIPKHPFPAADIPTSAQAPTMSNIRKVAAGARLLLPGVLLCIGVTGAATLLKWVEARVLGGTWLEALVLAILVGTAGRTAWTPSARWFAGINFRAKHQFQSQDPA